MDGNDNETSSFNGVILHFYKDNTLRIDRNGSLLVEGTWHLRDQGRELDIVVPALANENELFGEDLYEIYDDWNIQEATNQTLHLVDDDEKFELVRTN